MGTSCTFSITPQLSEEAISNSKFNVCGLEAKYRSDNVIHELTFERSEGLVFYDSSGDWSIEKYGLDLKYDLKIENPSILYEDMQLSETTGISMVARVLSKDSCQRFVYKKSIVDIPYTSDSLSFSLNVEIPPGKIRKFAVLELVLFVSNSDDDILLTGTVLGVMYYDILTFEGDNSIFPIDTTSYKGPNLWKLKLYYDDPREDLFEESVILYLNEKHPKSRYLKLNTNPLDSQLFGEIMAEVFFLILEDLKKDSDIFNDILQDTNLEPGSLGKFANFMMLHYGDYYDNPIKLSELIHENVESKMRGVQ